MKKDEICPHGWTEDKCQLCRIEREKHATCRMADHEDYFFDVDCNIRLEKPKDKRCEHDKGDRFVHFIGDTRHWAIKNEVVTCPYPHPAEVSEPKCASCGGDGETWDGKEDRVRLCKKCNGSGKPSVAVEANKEPRVWPKGTVISNVQFSGVPVLPDKPTPLPEKETEDHGIVWFMNEIEDYVSGNIETQAEIDRMAFTVFLRATLEQWADQETRKARLDEREKCAEIAENAFMDGVLPKHTAVRDFIATQIRQRSGL